MTIDSAGAIGLLDANITYVPIDADIQTYITAATAGDTLVLASGTYTITSTITVNKRLTIRGQGRAGSSLIPLAPVHGTTISCATAAVTAFDITSDDVLIKDLSINMTGAGSTGVAVGMDKVRVVWENVYVYINSTGLNTAFSIYSSDIILRDLTFYVISTDNSAAGVYFYNDSSSTINATLDAFTVTGTAIGNTGYAYAFACYNINDANTLTMNITNCLATASGGTVADQAVISTSATTNNSSVYCYNCILDGADYDAAQSGTNVLDVGGSTLLNETTFGTITRAGLILIDRVGLSTGTTVNEFSIDGTLAGNSDDAVPTEKAVKTYVDGATRYMSFNLADPNSLQASQDEWGIFDVPANMTITNIKISLNGAANELTGDLVYVDALIGLANPVVINVCDTTSGVLDDSVMATAAVPSGKVIIWDFDGGVPNAAITQALFRITFSYD
jgi:hypothetical protein